MFNLIRLVILAEPADDPANHHGVSFPGRVARPLEERVDHAGRGFQGQGEQAPHGRRPRALAADRDEVLEQPLARPALAVTSARLEEIICALFTLQGE